MTVLAKIYLFVIDNKILDNEFQQEPHPLFIWTSKLAVQCISYCEAIVYTPGIWPFSRGGLSSGVKINRARKSRVYIA